MEATPMDSSPAKESLPLATIKQDLILAYTECSSRGLIHSANCFGTQSPVARTSRQAVDTMLEFVSSAIARFPLLNAANNVSQIPGSKKQQQLCMLEIFQCIEMANSLKVKCTTFPMIPELSDDELGEITQFMLGKSLFDTREYRRAAHSLEKSNSPKAVFLRLYSLYLAGEKSKEDDMVDAIGEDEVVGIKNEEIPGLKEELRELANNGRLDAYGYYLYGILHKEQKLLAEAREMFVKSCQLCPMLWASWEELSKLCDDKGMLQGLSLPDHWMKKMFMAAAYMELLLVEEAMMLYSLLVQQGFEHCPYVVSQIALAHYHLNYFQAAIDAFQQLEKLDPYRLTSVDTYSNVLFVKGNKVELTLLAERATEIDRYRPETLCALGNLYTMRGEHENAVTHFKLATRINHTNLSAWILLGHSYIELRNPTLAIEAYTRALAINKRDFRGHYGLGQAYEILKMPQMAMYSYKNAHTLRPNDGRLLRALSECYLELNRVDEAKKCLKFAVSLSDNEEESILMLAKLHEQDKEYGQAASLYTKYLTVVTSTGTTGDVNERYHAHLFMSRHQIRQGNYKEAEIHAHHACQFDTTREKGKSLLREIYKRRSSMDASGGATDLSGLELDISPIALFQEPTQ